VANLGRCDTSKSIEDHRKNGKTWDVLVRWEDSSESWEPLRWISREDPVTLVAYAQNYGLLVTDGWKQFRKRAPQQENVQEAPSPQRRRDSESDHSQEQSTSGSATCAGHSVPG
jgi:hypothetical protein